EPYPNVRPGTECSVAIAEKNRDTVLCLIDDGQVGILILIEVARHDGDGPRTGGKNGAGRKVSVAAIQQNGNGLACAVDNGEVRMAIAIKISRSKRHRARADNDVAARTERSVAMARKYRYGEVAG